MNRLLRFLGPALRLMRERRDMRQCDLAGRARITKAMLSAYERRRRLPSLRTLSKLLDALDARLLDLGRTVEEVEAEAEAVARMFPPLRVSGS